MPSVEPGAVFGVVRGSLVALRQRLFERVGGTRPGFNDQATVHDADADLGVGPQFKKIEKRPGAPSA